MGTCRVLDGGHPVPKHRRQALIYALMAKNGMSIRISPPSIQALFSGGDQYSQIPCGDNPLLQPADRSAVLICSVEVSYWAANRCSSRPPYNPVRHLERFTIHASKVRGEDGRSLISRLISTSPMLAIEKGQHS